jgi:hypothetical protein
MEAVKINEASTWTWEGGHDSIGSGWNEGVNETRLVKGLRLGWGAFNKIRSMRMCLSAYHSFRSIGRQSCRPHR